MNIVAFDIGGTWIRGGYFVQGKLVSSHKVLVSASYADGKLGIAALARNVTGGKRFDRVIIGVPGVFDSTHSFLLRAPHLRSWIKKPMVNDFERLFKKPVLVYNDATLGGLGEAKFGAGKGYRHVAYIAIGTGIGGTLVVHGSTVGVTNLEPGHQMIEPGKTWEDLIGGKSLQHRFGSEWKQWKRADWNWVERQLAVGLVNITTLWSPDIIVLGGAVLRNSTIKLPVVRKIIANELRTIPRVPVLVRTKLGDSAGLYGALALTR